MVEGVKNLLSNEEILSFYKSKIFCYASIVLNGVGALDN